MSLHTLAVFFVLPIMLGWIGLALIPWRPVGLRLGILAVYLVATVLLIALVRTGNWFLAILLAPGALVAMARAFSCVRAIRRRGADSRPIGSRVNSTR